MKREKGRAEKAREETEMKRRRRENENAVTPCVCRTQQSGSESSSYKRAVTHSSALHPLATEGR